MPRPGIVATSVCEGPARASWHAQAKLTRTTRYVESSGHPGGAAAVFFAMMSAAYFSR